MADSTSPAGARAAYCKVLARSVGRARMPWNNGARFPVTPDAVCADAAADESASHAIGARAPAILWSAARQTRSFKMAPLLDAFQIVGFGKIVLPVLWSACAHERPAI